MKSNLKGNGLSLTTYNPGIYTEGLKKITNNCLRITDDSTGNRTSTLKHTSRKCNRYTNPFC